ncbi:hypothetical protein BU24DRAFT_416127 [Aaosphaeria arxii CBS 175.79]|uniref:Uncharacterized protein n=1 Tax=Aaosphaeria arxii CBS 175.79 TaxID=1450172 RepID=A0A6A5Y4G4_9PLEO|nr:uncharacterized protein BU24DRAFT_416127 [Aaosphaeria arxii CBS 175.79]KAF2020442.1 hypothetical protein BU24DRAFT_416127 [Aaosphaeria arxii CBS 175.79]
MTGLVVLVESIGSIDHARHLTSRKAAWIGFDGRPLIKSNPCHLQMNFISNILTLSNTNTSRSGAHFLTAFRHLPQTAIKSSNTHFQLPLSSHLRHPTFPPPQPSRGLQTSNGKKEPTPTIKKQERETNAMNRRPNRQHSARPSPSTTSSVVPRHAAISPGTPVSIVLKVDQPTGRQVTGIVSDVLTSGDHPRGVKVRLRDGRVGRVQRVVSEEVGVEGEEGVGGAGAGLGRDGEGDGSSFGSGRGRGRGGRGRGGRGRGRGGGFRHVEDVRGDEYVWDEGKRRNEGTAGFWGLEALEARDREEENGRRGDGGRGMGEVAVCPVCGDFEGDERAVAHHVEGHFGG